MKFRRATSLLVLVLFTLCSSAQDPDRKHSIGIYQNLTDYNVSLLNDRVFVFDSALSQSVRVAYQRRLSHNWMLNTGITNGFILNQNLKESFVNKAYAVGLDASVMLKMNNGKLLRENARVAPFLSFGYRTDYVPLMKKKYGVSPWLAHNQYGAGLNLKLAERSHLQLQALLDQKLQDDFNTHMLYRIGFTQSLGKYTEEKPRLNPLLDSDGDGVVDTRDKCPGMYGPKQDGRCPDTVAYLHNKIKMDSLQLVAKEQQESIERLELQIAMLRNGTRESFETDNEKSALLKEVYDQKLKTLQAELELAKNQPIVVRIDTVYKTEIVYKDADNAEEQEKLKLAQAELERKQREAEELRNRLKKEKEAARIEQERLAKLEKNQIEEQQRKEEARLAQLGRDKVEADKNRLEKEGNVDGSENDKPINVDPSIPEDKNFYIITISSPNISTAESWLAKIKIDFPSARILPQPNGYYRVGVYGAKDKEYSKKMLNKVKAQGYPAWLSVE